MNLRENFYGAAYQWSQNDATGDYQKIPIEAAATTDLEVGYEIIPGVKLYAGANNLLDAYPSKEPADYRQAQFKRQRHGYVGSKYPAASAFGLNGGFYYGRVSWAF